MIIDHFNYIWQLNIPKESLLAKLINDKNKKSGLCKEHYKEWKKATKEDRSLERARYDRG